MDRILTLARVTHGDELTFVHSRNSAPTNSTGEKEHVYEINGKRGCPDQRRRYCTCVFRDRRAIDERGKEGGDSCAQGEMLRK